MLSVCVAIMVNEFLIKHQIVLSQTQMVSEQPAKQSRMSRGGADRGEQVL